MMLQLYSHKIMILIFKPEVAKYKGLREKKSVYENRVVLIMIHYL